MFPLLRTLTQSQLSSDYRRAQQSPGERFRFCFSRRLHLCQVCLYLVWAPQASQGLLCSLLLPIACQPPALAMTHCSDYTLAQAHPGACTASTAGASVEPAITFTSHNVVIFSHRSYSFPHFTFFVGLVFFLGGYN